MCVDFNADYVGDGSNLAWMVDATWTRSEWQNCQVECQNQPLCRYFLITEGICALRHENAHLARAHHTDWDVGPQYCYTNSEIGK